MDAFGTGRKRALLGLPPVLGSTSRIKQPPGPPLRSTWRELAGLCFWVPNLLPTACSLLWHLENPLGSRLGGRKRPAPAVSAAKAFLAKTSPEFQAVFLAGSDMRQELQGVMHGVCAHMHSVSSVCARVVGVCIRLPASSPSVLLTHVFHVPVTRPECVSVTQDGAW